MVCLERVEKVWAKDTLRPRLDCDSAVTTLNTTPVQEVCCQGACVASLTVGGEGRESGRYDGLLGRDVGQVERF